MLIVSGILVVVFVGVLIGLLVTLSTGRENSGGSSRFLSSLSGENMTARNAEEAIAKLAEKSQEFGFENALLELNEKNSTKIDGDSYYRLQQNYHGIPVYGRTVVFATDEQDNMTSISGNVLDVSTDLDLTATITGQEAVEKIEAYFAEQEELDNIEVSKDIELNSDDLCIYNEDGQSFLAYKIDTNGYEILADAKNADILSVSKHIDNLVTYTDAEGKNKIEGIKPVSGHYILKDNKRNIYVYDAGKQTYWDPNSDEKFPEKTTLVWSPDTVFGDGNDNTSTSGTAYACLNAVGSMYDYYLDKYNEDGYGVLATIYNNYTQQYKGTNAGAGAVYWEEISNEIPPGYDSEFYGGKTGICIIGTQVAANLQESMDTLGHEYMHIINNKYAGFGGADGETGAINEGIADIFGEILAANIGNGADWETGNRNMANPSANDYPDRVGSKPVSSEGWVKIKTKEGKKDYTDYMHAYCILISHAAYLMNNGLDGKYRVLSLDQLEKLWYRAVLMMPSDCNFIECRKIVEYAAKSMKELNDEQRRCIGEAFDAVGIYEQDASEVDYNLKLHSTLSVYDEENEYFSGYDLHITGTVDAKENTDARINLSHSYDKTCSVSEKGPYDLNLEPGTYRLTISAEDEEGVYSFAVRVSKDGTKDSIIVPTSYKNVLVVKLTDHDKEYKQELYDALLQEYRDAIAAFQQDENVNLKENFPDVSEYLVSTNVERGTSIWYGYYDIDKNGIKELLFSYATIEGYEYKIVDVFSQDGENAVKIGEDDTFSEYTGSRIYEAGIIYSSAGNEENYYIFDDDGYHLKRIEPENPDKLGEEIDVDWIELQMEEPKTPSEEQQPEPSESISSKDLFGMWYSEEENRAYQFQSTGSDLYPIERGISSVDGTYVMLDLEDGSAENGGYILSDSMNLTLYHSGNETYKISVSGDHMILDGASYTHVSDDLNNQFYGIWKNGNDYVEFETEKFIQYSEEDGEDYYLYYVLSDSCLAVTDYGEASGPYRIVPYHIEGQKLTLDEEVYWKDGSDNSAAVLSGIRDAIIGFWYADDSYEGYLFYENGKFERYHATSGYDGKVRLANVLESGDYEIENSQQIKLYPNEDRYAWQEFTYDAQNQTIQNNVTYRKTEEWQ